MKITTRRELLKGLACGSLIVGFDPLSRNWVTGAEAASLAKLDHLPHLDGVLRTDDEALTAASGDYGRFLPRCPVAVLEPGHYGAQVDNVEALQVVTGEGHIVTCSRHHREDLFDAVLAGQGQCAVLARAVIKTVAVPARVRGYALLYPDVVTALTDADRLVEEKRFDGVVMFTFPDGNGAHSVVLRGTKYYSPSATPDDATLLAGLSFVPGAMQIDDLTYVENFSITPGPFLPLPHPAISVVLPASAATQFIEGVLPRLNAADLGSYNVAQIFAWRAARFGQPLMRIPTEEKLVGFALIRYAANALQVDHAEWRQHYGQDFDLLANAKRRYDARNVLASGPDIF